MKFKHFGLVLALGAFLPFLNASAAKVQNVKVEANYDTLNLLWDKLADNDFNNADGYALQWSDRQTDVKITKSVTIYQANNQNDISLRRNSFDNNTYYYARVYTYKIDSSNNKVLGNGSDMYKFKVDYNNTVTSEKIVVTDPVISAATGTEQDTSNFEFGVLRKYPYDTFADFFWSQPREMTSSDFDGFMIRVSKHSNMEDRIIEAAVDQDSSSVRVTGLTDDTSYYAQGAFYKNQGGDKTTFGESAIRSFKTIVAIPRDSSTRESRNIIKVEKRSIRKVDVAGTTEPTTSTSSSTTSNAESSTARTTPTTKQSTINTANQTDVKNKVTELKRQIASLQSELKRWEAKLETSTRTSSNTNSTSSVSNTTSRARQSSTNKSGLSIRERLKLILEAKRNQ